MKRVELSDQEIQSAITLFDVATKAAGLQVASVAAMLSAKLQNAEEVEEEAPPLNEIAKKKK